MQNDNSKLKIISGLIVVVIAIFFIVWFGYEFNRFSKPLGARDATETVEITPKTPSWFVAKRLQEKKLIPSARFFWLYQKLTGSGLQAGIYFINPSFSGKQILAAISSGRASEYRVTIPEGWRAEQIAQRLAEYKIVSYADFTAAAAGKEGTLFPDTYQISVKSTSMDIVNIMTENFHKRVKQLGVDKLSPTDLILASIVEREAKLDVDRPKMAGVYKNRIGIGMALEADPTVQYAVDTNKAKQAANPATIKFWGPISVNQIKNTESPYNTYRQASLPPAPISNPGIKSIEAALHPEKHDYFFFFNLDDGTTIYSKTREEHDANRVKHGI